MRGHDLVGEFGAWFCMSGVVSAERAFVIPRCISLLIMATNSCESLYLSYVALVVDLMHSSRGYYNMISCHTLQGHTWLSTFPLSLASIDTKLSFAHHSAAPRSWLHSTTSSAPAQSQEYRGPLSGFKCLSLQSVSVASL